MFGLAWREHELEAAKKRDGKTLDRKNYWDTESSTSFHYCTELTFLTGLSWAGYVPKNLRVLRTRKNGAFGPRELSDHMSYFSCPTKGGYQ